MNNAYISDLVMRAEVLLEERGGGEQFLGKVSRLARGGSFRDTMTFIVDLGEALELAGLQLVYVHGATDSVYVSRSES